MKDGVRSFSLADAHHIGETLGVHWDTFAAEQFQMGLNIEGRHRGGSMAVDGSANDPILIGRIALAHLHEIPDYYTQLAAITCAPLSAFHTFRQLLL